MAEAATVPVAYATAYYALVVKGNLRRGESVLIHKGAEDVRQAAVAVALSLECLVFTTISHSGEIESLTQKFPTLTENCFLSLSNKNLAGHTFAGKIGERCLN